MTTATEIEVLARTIWGEARNQGVAGMAAVASVVMNRARHPRWWGDDVASVCCHPYQFSCWNSDDPNRAKLLAVDGNDRPFAQALSLAAEAIDGVPDPTNGADSYYAGVAEPAWADGLMPCAIIGAHRFYRVEL